jgi:hypothetical protein
MKHDFNSIVENMIRSSLLSKENSLSYKIDQLKSQTKMNKIEKQRLASYEKKEKRAQALI